MIGFYIYLFKNRDKIKFVLKKSSGDVLIKPISEKQFCFLCIIVLGQVKTMIVFLIFQYGLQVIATAFFFFAIVLLLSSGKLTLINKSGSFNLNN